MEREFLKRLEEFRRRYYKELTAEELERCVREAARDGAVLRAYICASEILAKRQAAETRPDRGGGRALPRLPWQAYAGAAALALALAHPLAAVAALPIVVFLASARRNTLPMWTEGDALVWGGRRFKFYRVERVFRDVNGMGPHEFSNVLLATTHLYNGVYYREGQLWILLEEGRSAEEARTVLRRFGVVAEAEPSPPPVALRKTGAGYATFSLIPLAAFLAGPAAGAAALLPALVMLVLSLRDVGAEVGGALARNSAYYSVPDPESVHALARAAQPLIRETLVAWREDPEHLLRVERSGGWLERIAWWTASQWRLQRLGVVQVARQRILNLGERGFAVAGFVRGRSAAFAAGAPREEIYAFTRDLAEFTPYALMLTPFECGGDAVRLGVDDAGREVCISLEELQTPHAFLVGKSGAGKTTLGLSIAVQLWRRGVAPVAIDPHGHWLALRRWMPVQAVDARHHAPPFTLSGAEDVDLLLDVLRASGVQIYDVHFTVLYNALSCGPTPLSKLPDCLLKTRDLSNAWAVDAVYGRLAALAAMKTAKVDPAKPLVVHTAGSTAPDSRMKLILWTVWLVATAKRSCPEPPCRTRWLLFIDEGHALMRDVSYIVSVWRELRKFGVSAVLATQSVADIPQPLVENSGLKIVLAVEPEAVPQISQRLYMPQSVLQRVAYEALPEERYAVVRAEGRAPIYVRLHPPPEK